MDNLMLDVQEKRNSIKKRCGAGFVTFEGQSNVHTGGTLHDSKDKRVALV